VDGYLAHSGAGLDWTKYALETRVGDIIARKDPGYQRLIRHYKPEQTVGDIIGRIGNLQPRGLLRRGNPVRRRRHDRDLARPRWIDGINLRQFLTPGTAEDFIELVVPELRRRGRFREFYEEGGTLRERLFGAGHARLLDDHPGTRYRDPARYGA
jgi:long-chain alkane monooxygenase